MRQTPNKRLLGTNFYVWLYEQADSARDNGWNNWKRRVGEAPVLFDLSLTERSVQNLKVYMDSKRLLLLARDVRGGHRVAATAGEGDLPDLSGGALPHRHGLLRVPGPFLSPLILSDTAGTLLHAGDVFDVSVLDAERERITAPSARAGYYNFRSVTSSSAPIR